jgi:hypothetical protein
MMAHTPNAAHASAGALVDEATRAGEDGCGSTRDRRCDASQPGTVLVGRGGPLEIAVFVAFVHGSSVGRDKQAVTSTRESSGADRDCGRKGEAR